MGGITPLPCDAPPELSGEWYNIGEECVRECVEGDACMGRASKYKKLYGTFDGCCAENLRGIPNSPCPTIS